MHAVLALREMNIAPGDGGANRLRGKASAVRV